MLARSLSSPHHYPALSGDPLFDLHHQVNRLWEDAWRDFRTLAVGAANAHPLMQAPRLDMVEDRGEFCICVELPGVQAQDLDVRIDGDMLTIAGEKRSQSVQQAHNPYLVERSFGQFKRSVQLPFRPDPQQARAEFRHGVLTLRLPRQDPQEQSCRIEVRAQDEEGSEGDQRRLREGQLSDNRPEDDGRAQRERGEGQGQQGHQGQQGQGRDAGQNAMPSRPGTHPRSQRQGETARA